MQRSDIRESIEAPWIPFLPGYIRLAPKADEMTSGSFFEPAL